MFEKDKSIMDGKGESDDIDWITVYNSHIPIRKGEDIADVIEDHFDNPNYVMLPKGEYAELCSALKTKYGNNIPKKGKMLYKDYAYWYNYNENSCRVICTKKISIDVLIENYRRR